MVIGSVAALAGGLIGASVVAQLGAEANSFIRLCYSRQPEACLSASKEAAATVVAACLALAAVLLVTGTRWLWRRSAG